MGSLTERITSFISTSSGGIYYSVYLKALILPLLNRFKVYKLIHVKMTQGKSF